MLNSAEGSMLIVSTAIFSWPGIMSPRKTLPPESVGIIDSFLPSSSSTCLAVPVPMFFISNESFTSEPGSITPGSVVIPRSMSFGTPSTLTRILLGVGVEVPSLTRNSSS